MSFNYFYYITALKVIADFTKNAARQEPLSSDFPARMFNLMDNFCIIIAGHLEAQVKTYTVPELPVPLQVALREDTECDVRDTILECPSVNLHEEEPRIVVPIIPTLFGSTDVELVCKYLYLTGRRLNHFVAAGLEDIPENMRSELMLKELDWIASAPDTQEPEAVRDFLVKVENEKLRTLVILGHDWLEKLGS